jgi:hypothetical protein
VSSQQGDTCIARFEHPQPQLLCSLIKMRGMAQGNWDESWMRCLHRSIRATRGGRRSLWPKRTNSNRVRRIALEIREMAPEWQTRNECFVTLGFNRGELPMGKVAPQERFEKHDGSTYCLDRICIQQERHASSSFQMEKNAIAFNVEVLL